MDSRIWQWHRHRGGSVSHLQGAIYMPASDITFTGNSATTNGCTQVIGRTITFTGSSSLASSNCGPSGNTGTSTIATNETIAVTEYGSGSATVRFQRSTRRERI